MSCNCECDAVGYDVTNGDVENSSCIGEGKMDGVVGCRDGCCDIVRCPVRCALLCRRSCCRKSFARSASGSFVVCRSCDLDL